jgi:hypothetical protein
MQVTCYVTGASRPGKGKESARSQFEDGIRVATQRCTKEFGRAQLLEMNPIMNGSFLMPMAGTRFIWKASLFCSC